MTTPRSSLAKNARQLRGGPGITTDGVGRRYGRHWALRNCTLHLRPGSITALVGPNGAGKTTLLNLLAGLLRPSEGGLEVDGTAPDSSPQFLARIGYLAQDCPLYKEFSVADMLHFGRAMNPTFDDVIARDRIAAAEVPLDRPAGKLSGGQRAQVALALAVAKQPRVLLLDEPLAALDPLARREFLKALLDVAGASGMTVLLSSHLIGELARVCDHLVVIRDGALRLAGELDTILAEHHWVSGSVEDTTRLPDSVEILSKTPHERHTTLLVRTTEPLLNPALTVSPVDLEELVLAYLERPAPVAPDQVRVLREVGR